MDDEEREELRKLIDMEGLDDADSYELEPADDWMIDIDMMDLETLMQTWRAKSPAIVFRSKEHTVYILDRLTEFQNKNKELYDEISNRIGFANSDTPNT